MPLRLACFAPLALLCTGAGAAPADHIENDLLPGQWLVGQAPRPARLRDEMMRLHVPGVSIAVIHNGKVAWAKGYGVTVRGGAPVTPATLFQAGSISKPVTAVAAMRMVQDGKLALDRPANDDLASWKLPGGDAVTLRQLLSHTAGLSVPGFPGYAPGMPVPTLLQVLDGGAPAVTGPVRVVLQPGTQWRYSGAGYTVLQQLMTDVDQQPFDRLMAQRVLRPLGMRDSTFTQPAGAAILARAAMPHDDDGTAYPGGPFANPELAAAGLWSTPRDLATFLIALQQAAAGKPGALLTPQSARDLFTPVMRGYALGFAIDGAGGATAFSHGGHNQGYQSTMVAYAGRGDGVVVMTNGNNGDQVADALVRAVAKEYRWPGFQPAARSDVALTPAQPAAWPASTRCRARTPFWSRTTKVNCCTGRRRATASACTRNRRRICSCCRTSWTSSSMRPARQPDTSSADSCRNVSNARRKLTLPASHDARPPTAPLPHAMISQ